MAVIRSATKREGLRDWLISSQNRSLRLLAHAEEISVTVFDSLDNFIGFLDLTCRLHYYDAVNLLLVWEKYPSASYLGGYRDWEKQVPPGAQVLRKEHIGKGIELVAPFTDRSNSDNFLTWYSVTAYDLTQTNVQIPLPPFLEPGFIMDDDHEYFLLDSLRQSLSVRFGRSVSIESASQSMKEFGLSGQITETCVTVRDDLTTEEMLKWLTEALAQLSIEESAFSSSSAQLMRDSIRYCLFRIWGLFGHLQAPSSSQQLKSIDGQHLNFLHLLRDTVRDLNNIIYSYYSEKRLEEEDLDDLEL